MELTIYCFFLSLLTYSDAIRCFDCQDLPFPHDCAKVTECNSNEYCSTQQIVTTSGHVVYNTGCLAKERCSANTISLIGKRSGNTGKRVTDLSTCLECCAESFCNMKGCGVPGIPLEQRGLYCYNCETLTDPKACQKVAVCSKEEICLLYSPTEFRGLPEKLYRSECGKASSCGDGSVSTNTCAITCCSKDFCNDQCDTSQSTNITTEATHTWHSHETTLPSTSQSSSTNKTSLHCPQHGGYKRLHSRNVQLCLRIHEHSKSTWDNARSVCRNEGGDLVVLDTYDKVLLLRDKLTHETEYSKHNSYWIGAKDFSDDNRFLWTNSHPVSLSESDWASGELNHQKADCVAMIKDTAHSTHYQWHTSRCSDEKYYVCERQFELQ